MPARVSESFILRTWPFREADLVVSFFTRDQGKLRGVARRARRPKGGFGSGLERLSHATVSYYQKESRELVNLNSCELVHSQFALAGRWEASVALDYLAEISDHILPAGEASIVSAAPINRFTRTAAELCGFSLSLRGLLG